MKPQELFSVISRLPLGTDDKGKLYNHLTGFEKSIEDIIKTIGDIDDLTTETKENIVAAINELKSNIGSLNDLTTINKDDIVSAINELKEHCSEVIEISLTGDSGTLTSEEIATVLSNKNVVFNNDGKVFHLVNKDSDLTYRTYINIDPILSEEVETQAIYVQLDEEDVNYGTWTLEDVEMGGGIKIPTITISLEQVITSEPLTVQFTEEQDAIIISDVKFINIDATAVGSGVTTFIKEEANVDGDYMLISPTADYNSSTLIPETPTTQAIAYRHSTMIGVHKVLVGGKIDSETIEEETATPLFPFVEYVEQILSEEQKEQVRQNIGVDKIHGISNIIPIEGMHPNIFYNLGVITADPNIIIETLLAHNRDNEWMIAFSTGSTVPASITFPTSVVFPDTPTFEANKHYEVSMKYDATDEVYYGVIQSWDRE